MTENRENWLYPDASGLYFPHDGFIMRATDGKQYDYEEECGLLNEYDKKYNEYRNDVLRLEKENEQLKETINDLRAYDEEEYIEAKHLNNIYKEFGFDGVIKEVRQRLVYGTVTERDNLIRISTGGWSDDEALLDVLISPLTQFHYHYVGYIVGGAFYFDPDKSIESFRKVKLIKEGQ